MESDMKNVMLITVAMFDDHTTSCSNQQLLDNIISGRLFPERIIYEVHHNGPHGNPWGNREERGISSLKVDLKDFPSTPQCADWEGKYIDIWVTM